MCPGMLFPIMYTHVAWLSFSRLISIMFCELPLIYFHRLSERKLLSGGVSTKLRVSKLQSGPFLYYLEKGDRDMSGVHGRVNSKLLKDKYHPLKHLRPRQNCHHFADYIFKCIFLNEDVCIFLLKISLKFVPKVRINYIPAWVQIMAWRRPCDKPLFGPVMVSLLTHMCITRPQWDKCLVETIPVGKGHREVIYIQTDRYSWDCHWDAGPYVNTSWCFIWVPLHDFKWESYIDI